MKKSTAIVSTRDARTGGSDRHATSERELFRGSDTTEAFAVSVVNPESSPPMQGDIAGLSGNETGPYSWVHGLWLYNPDPVNDYLRKPRLWDYIKRVLHPGYDAPITREKVKGYYQEQAREGAKLWEIDFPEDPEGIHKEINYAWTDWNWCKDRVKELGRIINDSQDNEVDLGDDVLFKQCARFIRAQNTITVLEAVYGKNALLEATPPEVEDRQPDWF
jgi:hypothetical protein